MEISLYMFSAMSIASGDPPFNESSHYSSMLHLKQDIILDVMRDYDKRIMTTAEPAYMGFHFEVNHLNGLENKDPFLRTCGSIQMKWEDPRFKFNSTKFDPNVDLERIGLWLNEWPKIPFLPKFIVSEALSFSDTKDSRSYTGRGTLRNILNYDDAVVIIYSVGLIEMTLAFELETSCDEVSGVYPKDKIICMITFNPSTSFVMLTEKIMFANFPNPKWINSGAFLLVQDSENNPPSNEKDSSRSNNYIADVPSLEEPLIFSTKAEYKLTFVRNFVGYDALQARPVLFIECLLHSVMIIMTEELQFIALILMLIVEALKFKAIVEQLPSRYEVIPPIANMLLLVQLKTCLFFCWVIFKLLARANGSLNRFKKTIETIDKIYMWTIVFQLGYLYWTLYYSI